MCMCTCIFRFKCKYNCACMNAGACGVREKVDSRVLFEGFCEFTDVSAGHELVNDGTRKKMSSRMT